MTLCDPTQIRLDAYHDGELSAEEARRAEAHLAVCATCANELASIRATSAMLSRYAPAALDGRGLDRIREAVRAGGSTEEVLLPFLRRVAAAAAVVLAVGSVWLNRTADGPAARTVPSWERAAVAAVGMDDAGTEDLQFAAWVVADLTPGPTEER